MNGYRMRLRDILSRALTRADIPSQATRQRAGDITFAVGRASWNDSYRTAQRKFALGVMRSEAK